MAMKAIVLAAGRGSRMGENTAQKPKCMMELFGRPLLCHCIDSLTAAGFSPADIGIVTGYRNEQIQVPGVRYFHNPNWESTNMFVSLTKAREWLTTEPCVVVYADIVFHPSVITALKKAASDIAITYYTGFWELWALRFADPLCDLETFVLDGDKLIEIGKRPQHKSQVMGQFMGLLRFTPQGWDNIEQALNVPLPKPLNKLDMTTLLQHMLTLGHTVEAIATDKLWLECANPQDVALYEDTFSKETWNRTSEQVGGDHGHGLSPVIRR